MSCKIDKNESEFNKKKSNKDGLQTECRECNKEKSKTYYSENRVKMSKQSNAAREIRLLELRKKFYNFLKNSSCVDCGEKRPETFDFDHKDSSTKTRPVSEMIHGCYTWERVLEEIDKCDVRCANCHRVKTAKEQNWYYYIEKENL